MGRWRVAAIDLENTHMTQPAATSPTPYDPLLTDLDDLFVTGEEYLAMLKAEDDEPESFSAV
jgi:hypothetical protein